MLKKGIAKGIPSAPGFLPGIYISKLALLAADCGADFDQAWQRLPGSRPLPGSELESLDIEYADWLKLVAAVIEQLAAAGRPAAGLGLRFGAGFGIPDYGILAYAMLSCRDLGQCLETFQNLSDLFGQIAELECRFLRRRDEIAYRCSSHVVDPDIARFETETALAQFMALRNLLARPEEFLLKRVDIAFPAPSDPADYEQVFGCPVRFGREASELVLSLAALDAPFALANDEAWAACEQQCEALQREMAASGTLATQVRQLVLRSPGSIPELEDVARRLNMSARTLRRKLAAENTAFHEIVNDVRAHLARRYLRDTAMSVKEISYLLGYSEASNFQRAFKKWVGVTPGEYRAA